MPETKSLHADDIEVERFMRVPPDFSIWGDSPETTNGRLPSPSAASRCTSETTTALAGERAVAERPPSTLGDLLHPVGRDGFAAEYWERQPLVLHRGDPGFYEGLLSLADMDHILVNSSLGQSELCLMREGKEFPLPPRVDNHPLSPATAQELVYDAYRRGATIKLSRLHERWAPLGRLCRVLAAELGARVQTNIYLTPAAARGLKEHYDTHDVFVAQIHGTKHWRLYGAPFALPLAGQKHHRRADGLGEPVREFDLAPGDLLYLPRGWIHDATSQKEASLHLTIGVFVPDWAGLLQAAVAEITSEGEMFRASPPLAATEPDLTMIAGRLTVELAARLSPERLARDALAARRREYRPALEGHLLDLEDLGTISLRTALRRRTDTHVAITVNEAGVRLAFHGKAIRLPEHVAGDLRFAATGRDFTGQDLPGRLDDAGRMVLLSTLLREGFLTITDRRSRAGAKI